MNANEIKAAQGNGKTVFVVDFARVFDVMAAAAAGVDVSRLLVSQPDSLPQAVEVMEAVLKSGAVDVVVFFGEMGIRQASRVREAAARVGATFSHVVAERAPVPPTAAEVEAALVADVRATDRAMAKPCWSAVQRLGARVSVLAGHDATRPAHYALAWAIDTGRFSSEMEAAIRGMAPTAFARAALKIAHDLGGHAVREIYEAWRDLALANCKAAA